MNTNSEGRVPFFNLPTIRILYETFADDLMAVRLFQRLLYPLMVETSQRIERGGPAFSDIESELTYLYIRALTPTTVVEIGSGSGWSTSWMLHRVTC